MHRRLRVQIDVDERAVEFQAVERFLVRSFHVIASADGPFVGHMQRGLGRFLGPISGFHEAFVGRGPGCSRQRPIVMQRIDGMTVWRQRATIVIGQPVLVPIRALRMDVRLSIGPIVMRFSCRRFRAARNFGGLVDGRNIAGYGIVVGVMGGGSGGGGDRLDMHFRRAARCCAARQMRMWMRLSVHLYRTRYRCIIMTVANFKRVRVDFGVASVAVRFGRGVLSTLSIPIQVAAPNANAPK